jgi:5'-nucleotidase
MKLNSPRTFSLLLARTAARTAALTAALALALGGCAAPRSAPAPFDINLAAINDLHGFLEAQNFTYTSVTDKTPHTVRAGGIETLSRALQSWRAQDPELLLVGAGDLVGASPPLSQMWADEPTIDALNLLGLRASTVGNHEFDAGKIELLRKQSGGCVTPLSAKACQFEPGFKGAQFSYLAANVIDDATGKTLFPAYRIEQAHGVKIAFIGAVLQGTANVVRPSGVAGLHFGDEAEAINRTLPELKAQGVTVFVVLIHEGGTTREYFDEANCSHLNGPIVDIVKHLDPAIRLVISGHSHQGYLCNVDGRTVTQAQTAGHMLSRIALRIDPATQTVGAVHAENVLMLADSPVAGAASQAAPQAASQAASTSVAQAAAQVAPQAEITALLAKVRQRSTAVLNRPIARLALPVVTRKQNRAGESALGDLLTDAQLAASKKLGAQIVFLNHSTMRSDLYANADGVSTYSQSATVVPFGNNMVVMNLTGAEIVAVLEQQKWKIEEHDDAMMLEVSDGFSYRWDARRADGARVVPGSVTLHGVPLQAGASYRVAVNSFIAEGGDHYSVFKAGRERVDSDVSDIGSLTDYLIARDKAGTPAGAAEPAGRVVRLN